MSLLQIKDLLQKATLLLIVRILKRYQRLSLNSQINLTLKQTIVEFPAKQVQSKGRNVQLRPQF